MTVNAKKKRIWYPGAMFHVMSRGNRRTAIFKDDSDYVDFLEYLGKVKETFGFKLHAICLMTNHFHMAKGIDSYAHTAALKSFGYTIAVLGNGADICYPKEHERLYEMIAEKGCILSEYPPETGPREYLFPKRNRLIAALSDKLYVLEAGRNSGTNTTVEKAEEYGRKVLL